MKTVETHIPTTMLKAALLFAAKDDITRRYLCGVCVEHDQRGVRIIATDGMRLLICKVSAEPAEPLRYVVSRDVIANAVKVHAKVASVQFVWEQPDGRPDPDREGVAIVSLPRITVGCTAFGQQITEDLQGPDVRYPDIERIVPRKTSGKLAQFNPYFLADCAKAVEILKGSRPGSGFYSIMHNGDSAAVAELRDDAFAVIMPFRGAKQQDKSGAPEWFTGEPAPKAETEESEAEAA